MQTVSMIYIMSIFLNNFRNRFSTLANPNTEIGSARNRSFYLQANQKPKIEAYLNFRIQKFPRNFQGIKICRLISIRSQFNDFVIGHRLDLIILSIFVISLATCVLAIFIFADPDFMLVHARFRKFSREKIPHRSRPNKGLSRGSKAELSV